jgi:hypothetical protein
VMDRFEVSVQVTSVWESGTTERATRERRKTIGVCEMKAAIKQMATHQWSQTYIGASSLCLRTWALRSETRRKVLRLKISRVLARAAGSLIGTHHPGQLHGK